MKNRKWYNNTIKPSKLHNDDYIIRTDMGYIFQAYYEEDGWHVMEVHNGKCYFPLYENQDCIVQWMKV